MNQRHREHFAPQIDHCRLAHDIERLREVIDSLPPSINKTAMQLGIKNLKEAAKCA